MKYINLPKPHGFLIWRGKQKAIGSPVPALSGQKVMVISEGEPYGEAVFGEPIEMTPTEFAKYEEHHGVRPEEVTLLWPNADKLYTQWIKDWQPYEDFKDREARTSRFVAKKDYQINGDEVELIEPPELTADQKELLNRAERLPKTILLFDEAVTLEDGKAIIAPGCEACQPVLDAVLNGAKALDTSLHAYQLTLTRVPRLALKKKELSMEGEKCGDMPMNSYVPYGVYTFADLIAAQEANETAQEIAELSQQFTGLVGNIMASPDIVNKPAALASLTNELSVLMNQEANAPSDTMAKDFKPSQAEKDAALQNIARLYEADEKANSGFLVSGDDGDHLPTTKNGKVDHGLMGAAWAALHGGYRGNKYEGPGKSAALAKLKKLYAAEGMTTPSEKGGDVAEADKAGRKVRGSMMDRIKSAYETLKEFMSWAEPVEEDDEALVEKAFAIKRINGKPILITYSTNAFRDREGEIFSTKSLETYVAQAEAKGDRGTYDFWHIPGTDFAVKEWQAVAGKFLVEAGSFMDNEAGQAALKFFEKYPDGHPDFAPEGWGCSPKYRYLPEERKSGIYENIWISKTSVLPRLAAANIWTEGGIMAVSEQQEKSGKVFFGEELYTKLIGGAEDKTKKLQEAGVDNKSVDETPVSEETKPVGITLDDLQPFVEAMNLLATNQAELKETLAALGGEVKQLKITEEVKAKTQTPRAQLFTLQRATEAQKTIVPEGDPLIPVVNPEPLKDKSGAAYYFPQR